ncbi:MAG: PAS domain-containing protein [Planctomycetes bacterium]|nr:PAS domain-containing protein [Planctomycetota bacterium]
MKKTGLVNKIVYSKATTVLLFFFLSIFIILSLWFYHKLNQSQKQRYLSHAAADELRQSSDDLTRMVRTYAMTKDPRYEEMYWDILAIRNGEKARPVRYENIYWDFMAFTHEKPRPDGRKISLIEMMEDLEFTQEEFAKLAEAEAHSNELVWTETIAMHAMKGEFLDADGKFTKRGQPDYDYARAILYDESYHRDKVKIMTPIDEFFIMVDARTEAKVNRDTVYTYICISLVFVTIFLLLFLSRVELNERKLAEQALQSSEVNFSKVMVTSPDGIVIVDKNGVVQYVNPAAEYLFSKKAK